MIIYQNPKQENQLYGSLNKIPDFDNDLAIHFYDKDGDELTTGTVESETVLTNKTALIGDNAGGMLRQSDKKFIGVFIGTTKTKETNVIPGNWEPEQKEIKSLKIKTKPTKVSYTVGDALDLTGMQVELVYGDGDKEVISTGYTVSPSDGSTLSTAGDVTVTVTHTASTKTATFKVTVAAA